MRSRASLIGMLTVLSGCSSMFGPSACDLDAFFCKTEQQQLSELHSLPADRLARVTTINYQYLRPPVSIFSDEIGRRGTEGERILIGLANQKSAYDKYMVEDIVLSLMEKSKIDVCDSINTGHRLPSIELACKEIATLINKP